MARHRRSKSVLALAALALALWFWLAGPFVPDDSGSGPPAGNQNPATDTVQEVAPANTPSEQAGQKKVPEEGAVATSEVLQPDMHRETDQTTAAMADQFHGQMFVLDQAVETGRLAIAWRVVQEARRLSFSPSFADRLRERIDAVEKHTAETFEHWRQLLEQGSILEVERRVRIALEGGLVGPFPDLLRRFLSARGWPTDMLDLIETPDASPQEPRMPAPARGRWVSYLEPDGIRSGRVQSITGQTATVRVVQGQGVMYPEVSLDRLVWSEATVEEALEFSNSAARPRASLWMAHLIERGLTSDPRLASARARFSWLPPGGVASEDKKD